MKLAVFLIMLVGSIHSLESRAMTIEEAYASIPHKRTVFDLGASRLPRAQAEGLAQLFALTDRGIMRRVEAMRAFRAGQLNEFRAAMDGYQALVGALRTQEGPAELKPVQDLVLQAVQDHQRFFEARFKASNNLATRDLGYTPEVHNASQKLLAAYRLLMKMFPNEPPVNKAAFFDYLCALDFL